MSVKERESVSAAASAAGQPANEGGPAGEAAPMLPEEERVAVNTLLERVRQFAEQKARLVTITCLDAGGKLELIYHFDQNLEISHLRLVVDPDEEVPSISGIYLAAFLVENEMKEMFGLKVRGLAIDYGGRLLLSQNSPQTPMLKDGR